MIDLDAIETLLSEATPGPWRECGHERGGCKCGQVWSETADHPVLVVERGEWGDTYPAIRLTSGPGMHGTQAEAYLERIPYGEIAEEKSKANAALIPALRNAAPSLLALARAGRRLAEAGDAFVEAIIEREMKDAPDFGRWEMAYFSHRRALAAFREADA
jgi:hypothetical protein